MPSLEVAERISEALGFNLHLQPQTQVISAPRLSSARQVLLKLKNELKLLGVQHATIFGSVARGEDGPDSDIDICIDFGPEKPKAFKMLKAEGRILETFGENKVDIINQQSVDRNPRLSQRIQKDGIRVF